MSSILVLVSLFCARQAHAASVDSCPMYGCRPSGTFSYVLGVTSKVSLAWSKSYIQGPLTNSLGCTANAVNVVCQANGLRNEYKNRFFHFFQNFNEDVYFIFISKTTVIIMNKT